MFSKKLIWGLFLIWNHMWRSTTESKKQKQKTKNKQPTLEVEARMGTLAKAWLIWCFSPFMLHPWELPSPKHLGLPGTQFANHWSQYHSFSIESVTVFFFFSLTFVILRIPYYAFRGYLIFQIYVLTSLLDHFLFENRKIRQKPN